MLDFRMETFLEVCKDLNFTKTARRLNMTQPAVSQHIRWLEEAYGARLFFLSGKEDESHTGRRDAEKFRGYHVP